MRGIKAKRIRRMSEAMTIGQPERAYGETWRTRGRVQLIDKCTRKNTKILKKKIARMMKAA